MVPCSVGEVLESCCIRQKLTSCLLCGSHSDFGLNFQVVSPEFPLFHFLELRISTAASSADELHPPIHFLPIFPLGAVCCYAPRRKLSAEEACRRPSGASLLHSRPSAQVSDRARGKNARQRCADLSKVKQHGVRRRVNKSDVRSFFLCGRIGADHEDSNWRVHKHGMLHTVRDLRARGNDHPRRKLKKR